MEVFNRYMILRWKSHTLESNFYCEALKMALEGSCPEYSNTDIVNSLQLVQREIKAIKEDQERTEEELHLLKQSILDEAFGGEL